MTTEAYKAFRDSLALALALARQNIASADNLLQQLLLTHAVTLLEVYLQKLVESLIVSDDKLLFKLAQAKHFESHKLSLAAAIRSNPKHYILALVKEFNFHSLGDTEPLLRQAFNIKITITPELVDLIKLRNDVVHRNAHNKAGEPIELTSDAVFEATQLVEALVTSIDRQAVLLLPPPNQSSR